MNTAEISKNISKYGYHDYLVLAGVCPRYSYTIGVSESLGFELIIGGMCLFYPSEIHNILNESVELLKTKGVSESSVLDLQYGRFSLGPVHKSWIDFAAFGALDYYKTKDVLFIQILSDGVRNIDDPVMSLSIHDEENGAWKYLSDKWPYSVREDSEVLLDVGAINGKIITVVSRYEEDYWEMFSDVNFKFDGSNARILPLSVVIEKYPKLISALDMEIDTSLRIE